MAREKTVRQSYFSQIKITYLFKPKVLDKRVVAINIARWSIVDVLTRP